VDRYRAIEWRNPPRHAILIPYVGLFILSQFAFWISLSEIGLSFWIAFAATYTLNTGLNIYSHRQRTA